MSTITAVSRIAGLAAALAATAALAAACGGSSPGPAASPGQALYQQARTYADCMRAHGVPESPDPRPGPEGTLVYPLNPPAGMLTSAGYDAAFRACLKLAVTGGRPTARYQAIASHALRQAECMRAHGITRYPSPATIGGGIHSPDFTTLGLDTHTPQFQAAGRACGWPACGRCSGGGRRGRCSGDRRRGAQGGFGGRGPPAGANPGGLRGGDRGHRGRPARSGPGHQLQRGIRDRFHPLPRCRPRGDDRRGEGDPRATGRDSPPAGGDPGGWLSGDHDQPHVPVQPIWPRGGQVSGR